MKTNYADLNKSVTAASILSAFYSQQDAYLTKHGKTSVVRSLNNLEKYAKLCFKAFKANLKLCGTPKDHKRLHNFFAVKTSPKGRDFLNAAQ